MIEAIAVLGLLLLVVARWYWRYVEKPHRQFLARVAEIEAEDAARLARANRRLPAPAKMPELEICRRVFLDEQTCACSSCKFYNAFHNEA
jgi:hypothetical protein